MWSKLRRLLRREQLTPDDVAERERLDREAQRARHQAELEVAKQRGHVEGYLDRHPPIGGGDGF